MMATRLSRTGPSLGTPAHRSHRRPVCAASCCDATPCRAAADVLKTLDTLGPRDLPRCAKPRTVTRTGHASHVGKPMTTLPRPIAVRSVASEPSVATGSAPRCSIKASQTAPGPGHGWVPKPCGNEWRENWKNKGRSDLLPGAHGRSGVQVAVEK